MPELTTAITHVSSHDTSSTAPEESILEEGNQNGNIEVSATTTTAPTTAATNNKKKVLFFLKKRRGSDISNGTATSGEGNKRTSSQPRRQLSVVSKKYDIDGDGILNEKEQALRDLDVANRGFISNARVYKIIEEQMDMQRSLLNFKRLLIGLGIFTFILALSNLGTAWAAAKLAKDTTVTNGKLVDKNNRKVTIATDSNIKTIEIVESVDNDQRRELQQNFTTTHVSKISQSDAIEIYDTCPQEVWLKRTTLSGVEQNIKLCPNDYGHKLDGSVYSYPTGPWSSENVYINCTVVSSDGYCDLSGSALDLKIGDTCAISHSYECRSGLCNFITNKCLGGTDEVCNTHDECKSGSCTSRPTNPPVNKCDECNPTNNQGCDTTNGWQCYSSNDVLDAYMIDHLPAGCYKPTGFDCTNNVDCISNTCENNVCM